jgi:hypothetical protein
MIKQALIGGLIPAFFLNSANAGVLNDSSPHPQEFTYCFVGDASTNQTTRTRELEDALEEISNYGNIKFIRHNQCRLSNNGDYTTELRIIIPSVSTPSHSNPYSANLVPGCNINNEGGSWAQSHTKRQERKKCLFNVKIGNDNYQSAGFGDPSGGSRPFKDHALHEFGHALGLGHEHMREDTAQRIKNTHGENANLRRYVTSYDPKSVMHYTYRGHINFAPGNYANKGLSSLDKVTLKVLYPESDMKADFLGNITLLANTTTNFTVANVSLGAHPSAYKDYTWKINQQVRSRKPSTNIKITRPGRYTLSLTYRDLWNRPYALNQKVEVISAETYKKRISTDTTNSLLILN